MDGVLLIDKPQGATSHDVVAWARRAVGQPDIGHAGTLDPLATGLLVLLVGRATRLSSYLTGKDKAYDAEIRLGFATTTDDALGDALGPTAPVPNEAAIRSALSAFVGEHAQRPPAHSAKKVAGRRAYEAARRQEPLELAPVQVSMRSFAWLGSTADRVTLRLTVSAGFYVRALARDLGVALGCGGHLAALRRTASGALSLDHAMTPAEADRLTRQALEQRLIALADALAYMPAAQVGEPGLSRIRHGNALGPPAFGPLAGDAPAAWPVGSPVRIVSPSGALVAVARWRDGSLHPVTVLG